MLTALSHDFILHRNLHIAFNSEKASIFILSTHGSHHLHLMCAIAQLHNQLHALEPESQSQILPALPKLHAADSSEIFGLVNSEHASTFGSLLKEEKTSPTDIFSDQPLADSDEGDVAERALRISQEVLFNEWHIDPVLLDQPASQLQCHASTPATLLPMSRPSAKLPVASTSMLLTNTTHVSAETEPVHHWQLAST